MASDKSGYSEGLHFPDAPPFLQSGKSVMILDFYQSSYCLAPMPLSHKSNSVRNTSRKKSFDLSIYQQNLRRFGNSEMADYMEFL